MKKMMSLLAVLVLVFSTNSFALDKKAKKKTATKKDAKASDVTENAKLKAELGSMSTFSMSGSLGYTGASLKDPFGDQRPNPDSLPGNYSTYLSGSISARYRLDKSTSITGGASFLYYIPENYVDRDGEIVKNDPELSNPSLSYNKVIKGDGYVQTKS